MVNLKFYPIDLYKTNMPENSAKMGKISCQKKTYFEKSGWAIPPQLELLMDIIDGQNWLDFQGYRSLGFSKIIFLTNAWTFFTLRGRGNILKFFFHLFSAK